METPLTPLEFARRSRQLTPSAKPSWMRSTLSYEQFFDRCDAWSAALQALGVNKATASLTIAPNTHRN